jgi:nitrite reductase/ring-hydroxylating ferredoxin subunit/uncharacterized membrane protein
LPDPLLVRIVRRQSWMEPLSDLTQKAVGGFYDALGKPGRYLKGLLSGTYVLRHPLHPVLTDIPLGAWTVVIVADYAAHFTSAVPYSVATVAATIGLVASFGALVTGYTDFHGTADQERRFGCAHGLLMTIVVLLYTISVIGRLWLGEGSHAVWVGLATAGYALVLLAAWLGGHLVFGIGYSVNRDAFLAGPTDWVPAGLASDVPASGPHLVEAGGMQVVMVRSGGKICALSDVCSHAGGPLHEGEVVDGVIICPWHLSRYRLRDGHVVSGPSTFDQPRLLVRDTDGKLEVKLEQPLH